MNWSDPVFLFASLVWGLVGVGYFMYGRRRESLVASLGGVALVAASYFAPSAGSMCLIGAVLVAGVHWLLRRGE
jgi:membrane-bound ClpP family serine protease